MKYIQAGPPRYAHQRRGLNKLIQTGGVAALLFDPGLGKTATVIDYMGLLALKASPDSEGLREVRVLVVCPLVAVDTWVTQVETYMTPMVDYWAEALGGSLIQRGEALASRGGQPFRKSVMKQDHHPRALHHKRSMAFAARNSQRERAVTSSEGPDGCGPVRVVMCVTNIDTFTSMARHGSGTMADYMLESVKRFSPEMVVVDESHKIKGAHSNASRLLARISKHVKRRVLLTGTVMPHSPLDVFGQWRFLQPYAFGDKMPDGAMRQSTYSSFKSRYAILGGYMGHEVTGFRNLDEMQKIMAQNAIVARKADSLDLPPTTDTVVPVHLSPKEKQAYLDMKSALAASLAPGVTVTAPNMLSQMMRLRQITAGFIPDDNGVVRSIGSSKVDTITSLVHDTLVGEKRIVVFALFTREIEMLRSALAKRGTVVDVITGGTPGAERVAIRHRFGSDDPARIVLIAQIKTMSLAVNELVTASHAIFATLSQQRDDIVQARDRLNRIGQTRPCTFWFCLSPATVDDVVYQSYLDRSDLEAAMLKHVLESE